MSSRANRHSAIASDPAANIDRLSHSQEKATQQAIDGFDVPPGVNAGAVVVTKIVMDQAPYEPLHQ
jgi:hypothetical protein